MVPYLPPKNKSIEPERDMVDQVRVEHNGIPRSNRKYSEWLRCLA
jgi:hypothetical protein